MRGAGDLARKGGEERVHTRFGLGKNEIKRKLVRHSRIWMDNIKMGHREKESEGMDWIELAQDSDEWQAPENT